MGKITDYWNLKVTVWLIGYMVTIHSSSWNITVMVNDVFVSLSWVTHLSIKQTDYLVQ